MPDSQGPSPGEDKNRLEDALNVFRKWCAEGQRPSSESSTDESEREHPTLQRLGVDDDQPRYRLRREVARGGMGVVLEVFDRHLRRTLAMKVILPQHTTQGEQVRSGATPTVARRVLDRFLEEAQITGQLNHPGIVPLHELGVGRDGRVYFTMRLVRGQHLGDVFEKIRSGTDGWTLSRAVGVIQKCCEAMAYAHSKHVVHRDLKPANIMVGQFGEVYVMDWGLARLMPGATPTDSDAAAPASDVPDPSPPPAVSVVETDRRKEEASPFLTMVGDIIGTPAYMSPEQAAGALEDIGPKSDIYSIGAILYEMLAGAAPYREPGEDTPPDRILSQLRMGPPERLSRNATENPPELVAICERAMQRNPEDRYADAMDLTEDLRAYLEKRPVRAHRTGPIVECRLWIARNKALSAAILIVILSLTTFAYLQTRALSRANKARRDAETATKTANAEKKRAEDNKILAERQRATAQWRGYLGDIAATVTNLQSGNIAEAHRRLRACPPSNRGWEFEHLGLASDLALARAACGAEATTIAYDPKGRTVAVSSGALIQVRDARTLALTKLLRGHEARVLDLAFLPDGLHLVSAAEDATARLWDLSTESSTFILRHAGPVTAVDVDSAGNLIATGSVDQRTRIWDADSGSLIRALPPSSGAITALAFRPKSTLLAQGAASVLRVFDVDSGADLQTWSFGSVVSSLGWHPTANKIAICTLARASTIVEVGESNPSNTIAFAEVTPSTTFIPDGSQLVYGAWDRRVWIFDASTYAPVHYLQGHTAPLLEVVTSPDGERILSLDRTGNLRTWDARTRHAHTDLPAPSPSIRWLQFSQRDTRMVATSENGDVRMFDARSGKLLWHRELPGVRQSPILPDGHVIVAAGHKLRVLDRRTGADTGTAITTKEPLDSLWINEAGDKILASSFGASGGQCHLFDRSGEPQRSWSFSGEVSCGRLNRQGTLAAIGVGSELFLFDTSEDEPIAARSTEHGTILSVAFSPKDGILATGHTDDVIVLHDAKTLTPLRTLLGHAGAVHAVAFSPDGERIASGSADQTVSLWDVAHFDRVCTLVGHGSQVSAVVFSRDGTRLASGEKRRTAAEETRVRVWESELAAARRMWEQR